MPVVHAWHAHAAEKTTGDRNSEKHARKISREIRLPTARRIALVNGAQDARFSSEMLLSAAKRNAQEKSNG